MPMYDFYCPNCKETRAVFRKIYQRDLPHFCGTCNGACSRQIAAPRVVTDYAGYQCPITNTWIEGRKAHRENLAKHGCRVMESGEREAAERSRRRSEEQLENAIGETVEREITLMSSEKREALASDLQHFSAEAVRT